MTTTEDLAATLQERGKTHGSFSENGVITQRIREALRTGGNWRELSEAQQTALDEIALKMARIVSTGSSASDADHWRDGAGYFTLGAAHG